MSSGRFIWSGIKYVFCANELNVLIEDSDILIYSSIQFAILSQLENGIGSWPLPHTELGKERTFYIFR